MLKSYEIIFDTGHIIKNKNECYKTPLIFKENNNCYFF